ncbi:Clp protease N-terminal domain-containing protein [Streptomyces kutzneri]|uniref:Clp protease N-terminal domain-containing protein n=1 Tax=Streptomyces kutzneri TaxID=3051179 RepID=UPI0028D23CCC|nr:Clp protease N-terminal domain-containing protein [Streptomyces sp. DSM 40907]
MTSDFRADQALLTALGPVCARRHVSTHLLLSCISKDERVQEFLAAYHLTTHVIRHGVGGMDEEPGKAEVPLAGQEGRSLTLSTAGAAALARCRERPSVTGQGVERSPADLLVAVLDDPSCGAVSYLNGCGVDVVALQQAVRSGQVPPVEDAVPPELRSTRDALVGRRRYKPRELGQFWTTLLVRVMPMNAAAHPVLWARLEAGELAGQHRGKVRTDDVLLGMLRTYAVARAYPHLMKAAKADYDGGRVLVESGVDHERVRAVMASTDLGQDTVPPRELLKDTMAGGTSGLLDRLLSEPGNRCVRLLAALDVESAGLRRPAGS